MSAAPLAPPPLANGAIARLFYRVMVVDQPWYLLGNRTASAVLGVGPDDQRIPVDLLPVVRDQVDIDYLTDGLDTLAEATRILTRPSQSMIVAVSPISIKRYHTGCVACTRALAGISSSEHKQRISEPARSLVVRQRECCVHSDEGCRCYGRGRSSA